MKSSVLIFMLLVGVLALFAPIVSAKHPEGSYCGDLEGVVDVTITISDDSHVAIKATIMGEEVMCNGEPYSFDEGSGKVTIPGLDNPDDCIGKIADEFGVTPDTVEVTYDSDKNSITIDIGFGSVDLNQCKNPEAFLVERAKHHAKDDCCCCYNKMLMIGGVTFLAVSLFLRRRRRLANAEESEGNQLSKPLITKESVELATGSK